MCACFGKKNYATGAGSSMVVESKLCSSLFHSGECQNIAFSEKNKE
jgi:hypothetical protein